MFKDEISSIGNSAATKVSIMKKTPASYFILSMLAGIFVGIGVLLIFTIGGILSTVSFQGTKIVMGISFGVALSLVIMAGSELFTGNNFVMAIGIYTKKVSISDTMKLWIFCWLGNLVGSILLAVLFAFSGLANGDVGNFIAQTSAAKINVPAIQLLIRGILCNMLVCLAVWCSIKMKSESGKLIMIFWCLFAFITAGFEHSVANMTLLSIGFINPMNHAINLGGYFYNLAWVTLGNMIGGILLIALPYAFISDKTTKM